MEDECNLTFKLVFNNCACKTLDSGFKRAGNLKSRNKTTTRGRTVKPSLLRQENKQTNKFVVSSKHLHSRHI